MCRFAGLDRRVCVAPVNHLHPSSASTRERDEEAKEGDAVRRSTPTTSADDLRKNTSLGGPKRGPRPPAEAGRPRKCAAERSP